MTPLARWLHTNELQPNVADRKHWRQPQLETQIVEAGGEATKNKSSEHVEGQGEPGGDRFALMVTTPAVDGIEVRAKMDALFPEKQGYSKLSRLER